jgi:hypothetical protein
VYNKCVILLSRWVTLNAAPFRHTKQLSYTLRMHFLNFAELKFKTEYRAFVNINGGVTKKRVAYCGVSFAI